MLEVRLESITAMMHIFLFLIFWAKLNHIKFAVVHARLICLLNRLLHSETHLGADRTRLEQNAQARLKSLYKHAGQMVYGNAKREKQIWRYEIKEKKTMATQKKSSRTILMSVFNLGQRKEISWDSLSNLNCHWGFFTICYSSPTNKSVLPSQHVHPYSETLFTLHNRMARFLITFIFCKRQQSYLHHLNHKVDISRWGSRVLFGGWEDYQWIYNILTS